MRVSIRYSPIKEDYMKRKVFQIGGIIALMITMTACGKQVQAETVEPTTIVETTIQETTAEPTTEEATTEYADGAYSGQRENGDAFVKLDLPTLSTGKTFDEIAAMQYEIVYNSWSTTSDTEKAELGKEGLKDLLGSLVDFTDQEKDEVVDYILSKSPIPAQEASKQESKPAQSSNSNNETKAAPKETQASVQPTQPAQEAQVPTEPVSYETDNTTELSPEMQERHRKLEEMAEQNGGSVGHEAGYGTGGDDLKDGEINIGG